MKTRVGFVSNSSSTSFVVAYKTGDVCPHCHRKDPDLSDVIKQAESPMMGDSTKLYLGNTKDVIDAYEKDISELKKKYQDLLKTPDWISFSNERVTITNKQEAKWIKKDLDSSKFILEQVKKYEDKEGWNVILFDLSYHDSVPNVIFNSMKSANTAIELDKEIRLPADVD